jgi:deoxyadenosine/deoxycytidine kinase
MLIEFAGAPGSGKTTLAQGLAKRRREAGEAIFLADDAVSVFNARSKFGATLSSFLGPAQRRSALGKYFRLMSPWYYYKFRFNHQAFSKIVQGSFQNRSIPRDHVDLIRSYFERAMIYYQFISDHRRASETIMFDEGFAHRITHFVSDEEIPDVHQVEAYCQNKPGYDVLVYLDLPVKTCEQRVLSRGLQGRMKDLNSEQVHKFILHSKQALEIGINSFEDQDTEIIRLGEDGDLDGSITSLESRIFTIKD